MKIGLVCPYNIWGSGGVQECVLALHEELSARGHAVKIITPLPRGFKGEVAPYILTAGMSANVKAFFNTQTQFSASIDNEAIHQMLEDENFDVLHFHEPWVPIASRQVLTRSKSANVATSHATIPDRFTSKAIANMFNSYTRGLIKYIHAYSAVSEPASQYVKTFIDQKVEIIPNGIDLAKYKPMSKTPKKIKTILYIGRLEKRKGVRYLLKIFKTLAEEDKNVRLVLAGDGPLRESLEEWVHENHVPRVSFLGFVSEKKKYDLLQNADLFCSPALYGESFGIVLLEAMAMGLVTVAGDNPGYVSVLRGKGEISLVKPKDLDAFLNKVKLLLYDEAQRREWLAWAKVYIKQFNYATVVDQYEALYEQSLNQKKRQQS
jgi:phosphatidylinositol alpha-mannosyltransferase